MCTKDRNVYIKFVRVSNNLYYYARYLLRLWCSRMRHGGIVHTPYRSFIFRWSTNCTHTMRSISLDRKERLETGPKFFKISQSSMAFFRSGKMKALFSSGEKSANSREVLTMSVSTGVSSSKQSLRMDVGIGSREHDLLGDDDIIFRTSSWCTMRNSLRGTPSKSLITFIVPFGVFDEISRAWRMDFETLGASHSTACQLHCHSYADKLHIRSPRFQCAFVTIIRVSAN